MKKKLTLVKQTLSEQIYELLREAIFSGEIAQGSKITLKQLQENFGVSSTPIREALTRLTEDGLIEYSTNIGVKVICLNETDIKELYEFMGDLDALAILYASRNENQAPLLTELKRTIDRSRFLMSKEHRTVREMAEWAELSDHFHLVFYDYCSNSLLKKSAERQRSQMTIFSNQYEAVPEIQFSIEEGHLGIYEAYLAGQYEEAAERMRQHLKTSLQYAIPFIQKDKENQ